MLMANSWPPETSSTNNKQNRSGGAAAAATAAAAFEYCVVCRLNHDQGRRHRYFPAHKRALAELLSRFQSRFSDLRFFLRNPTLLPPEHAKSNRIWCYSCSLDLTELDSSFACEDAIRHMASEEHLKNLKHFLWKHGGSIDKVDVFRVSEVDFIKWDNSCKQLNSDAAPLNEGPIGPSTKPLKDIQLELANKTMDKLEENSFHSFNSSTCHSVMPLQSFTNEKQWKHCPDVNETKLHGSCSSLAVPSHRNAGLHHGGSVSLEVTSAYEAVAHRNGARGAFGQPLSNGFKGIDQSGETRGNKIHDWQNLTRISSQSENYQGNVHSGAIPPWLETGGGNERDAVSNESDAFRHCPSISSTKKLKSTKLNPKRVGAEWAEKRRLELELEKRGEIVPCRFDPNWLPNFGRVWQAGTRKESKREFKVENQNVSKEDDQSNMLLNLQPYIGKRKRTTTTSKT